MMGRQRSFERVSLRLLPGIFAVSKLAPGAPVPEWAVGGPFSSVTRTEGELSIICAQKNVPEGVASEPGWRCLRVMGTLEFSMVGVLASLVDPLASAGIAIFVIATFDTDYLLVKAHDFVPALEALERAGHHVEMDADFGHA
jgi:hypothetical protein